MTELLKDLEGLLMLSSSASKIAMNRHARISKDW